MMPLFAELYAEECTEQFVNILNGFAPQLAVLPDKSEETAAASLAALWCLAQGLQVSVVAAGQHSLLPLSVDEEQKLHGYIAQRLAGVPLAHITGRQHFMGLELLASAEALIPRAETELLVHLALECLDTQKHQPLKLLDVCTGSGNVALSLAHHLPNAQVYAADLSAEAVQLAKRNAQFVQLHERVEFKEGDLCGPYSAQEQRETFDLISCNPPYIMAGNVKKMPKEIAEHEPTLAFDGGPMGIAIIERIIIEAHPLLKPGGFLCLEVGAGQGAFIEKRMRKSGLYQQVVTACDAQNVVRALAACK
ncbi:MAG TPA: peptide chain release factor N(5)-glutamine methyltransferase [Cellvibrionaceae bacterium]